jgi:hypothetical protein
MPSLAPGEREQLDAALRRASGRRSELTRFASLKLELNLEELGGDGLREQVINLIAWAEDNDRLPDLVEGALVFWPGSRALQAIGPDLLETLARDEAPFPKLTDVYEACMLRGGLVFLDRTEFREHLRRFERPEEHPRTLVVTGETRSGKSYSANFIYFVAAKKRLYEVRSIDLREQGPAFGPEQLMRKLLLQMGKGSLVDSLPPRQAQTSSWTSDVADWFVGGIADRDERWLFIFDHVIPEQMHPDTLDLVKKLVSVPWASTPWIVLLDCKASLPNDIRHLFSHDPICAVDEQEAVSEFFERLRRHKDLDRSDDALQAAVADVLDNVDADASDRLAAVAQEVDRVAKAWCR